jgi:hypothetical protein
LKKNNSVDHIVFIGSDVHLLRRKEGFKDFEEKTSYLLFVAVNPGTVDVSVPRLQDPETN